MTVNRRGVTRAGRLALLGVALAVAGCGPEPEPPAPAPPAVLPVPPGPPGKPLAVGDALPPLAADGWLNGPPPAVGSPGARLTVVDLWAA